MLSEEEIIKVLSYQINMKGTDVYTPINYDAIQGILDLYYKQQEEIEKLKIKNKKIQEINYKVNKNLLELAETSISKDKIREYVNSPEFLDWHLGFTLLDELEYRKNNINELLEE